MPSSRRSRTAPLWRIALRLHKHYLDRAEDIRHKAEPCLARALEAVLKAVQRTEQLLQHCHQQGWFAASHSLSQRHLQDLYPITDRIAAEQRLHAEGLPSTPSLRDLYEELRAAEDEFGAVEFIRHPDRIAVTTEAIVLEGVHLGQFRIELLLDELRNECPINAFSIEALQPLPAGTDERVTHPHVNDGGLCSGDGGEAICLALADGRLCDFFTLVRSVLRTYNAESAYVSLDTWEGSTCYECGYVFCDDDLATCPSCHEAVCGTCTHQCVSCEYEFCRSCLKRIELSGKWVCDDCAGACDDCGRTVPSDDLQDGLCPGCAEASVPTSSTGAPHLSPQPSLSPQSSHKETCHDNSATGQDIAGGVALRRKNTPKARTRARSSAGTHTDLLRRGLD